MRASTARISASSAPCPFALAFLPRLRQGPEGGMVVGRLETLAGVAVSLWVSPWKLFSESELYQNWGELVLVAVFLALILFWMLMDRKTSLRLWMGVLAVAIAVKLVWDDGRISHTVSGAGPALPRAAVPRFH